MAHFSYQHLHSSVPRWLAPGNLSQPALLPSSVFTTTLLQDPLWGQNSPPAPPTPNSKIPRTQTKTTLFNYGCIYAQLTKDLG